MADTYTPRRAETLRSLASYCHLHKASARLGWVVTFNGHEIGSVIRKEPTGTWLAYGIGPRPCAWESKRFHAVARVLLEYEQRVGGSSRLHNVYLDEVQNRFHRMDTGSDGSLYIDSHLR